MGQSISPSYESVVSWTSIHLCSCGGRPSRCVGSGANTVPQLYTNNVPVDCWPKTLILVRHGESTYNLYHEQTHSDPMNLWDAPLTAKGEDQASSLTGFFSCLRSNSQAVQVALTSPLTRSVQTALRAMPPESSAAAERYEVSALLAEHLEASCDIGRTPEELAHDFSCLDFGSLAEVWWYIPEEFRGNGMTMAKSRMLFAEDGRREPRSAFDARVDAAAAMLAGRTERTIAVFGHADFFNTLLRRWFSPQEVRFNDYWMKNAEALTVTVASAAHLTGRAPGIDDKPHVDAHMVDAAAEAAAAPLQVKASRASRGVQALRSELAAADPSLKGGELMKKTSQVWKSLDDAGRTKYMTGT